MSNLRQLVMVTVVVVIAVLATGSVSAYTPAPAADHVAQGAQTPDEICAQATENLSEPETRQFEQAEDVLQEDVDYWAVICTDAGAIYVNLLEDQAPLTVNNFVFLAQQDFYNNTTFHRVLPGFMAQGGDPTGTGAGDAGYEFEDETSNGLVFDRAGLLAMANSGPDTNGSQFFITYVPTPWLDGNHTIFGRVYQGINEAELLTPRDPNQNPTFEGDTLHTVVIIEDPSSVAATEDGPPDVEHFQALFTNAVISQINQLFVVDEDASSVYDLDAQATAWAEIGGDELVDYMRGYLAENGFQGAAVVKLYLDECPVAPEDLPIWGLGFQVADYGSADAAESVVADDARSDTIVEAGAFAGYEDSEEIGGRVYSRALGEEAGCGPDGVYYRFETSSGRYVIVTELVLDSAYISAESDPTANQYLGFVAQDLLLPAIAGTLERGNAATE